MKTKLLIMLMLMNTAAAQNYSIPLNSSQTSYLTDYQNGRQIQAIRNVFTDFMGGWFYTVLVGVFFIGFWIKMQNLIYPVLMLDIILVGGGLYTYIPPEAGMPLALLHAIAFGTWLFYKPLSPVYSE